jgi:hypothetical protein
MFSNTKPPPKPVIRKVTVSKPVQKTAQSAPNGNAHSSTGSAQRARNGASASQRNGTNGTSRGYSSSNGLLRPEGHRPAKSRLSSSNSSARADSKTPSRRVNNKRKAPSPSEDPHFSSSSSDDEDGSSIDMTFGSKRAKPSPRNGSLEPDMKRRIFRGMDEEIDENEWPIVQGAELTVGLREKEFKRVFAGEGDLEGVELRYASAWPKERWVLFLMQCLGWESGHASEDGPSRFGCRPVFIYFVASCVSNWTYHHCYPESAPD